MPQLKRATVYFDPSLHKALRLKAANSECSVSELVNAAVRRSLAEDIEDLAAFRERAAEPAQPCAAGFRPGIVLPRPAGFRLRLCLLAELLR
jgi:hypothetical protein